MTRFAALALVALALTANLAPAQVIYVPSPRVVYSAPVVSYPAPVVTYASPVVTYSSPVVTYASPAPLFNYSYYPPATTTYYAPATTVYSVPATVAVPGVVTTRSYYGFGIFRPRGVYTETYVR